VRGKYTCYADKPRGGPDEEIPNEWGGVLLFSWARLMVKHTEKGCTYEVLLPKAGGESWETKPEYIVNPDQPRKWGQSINHKAAGPGSMLEWERPEKGWVTMNLASGMDGGLAVCIYFMNKVREVEDEEWLGINRRNKDRTQRSAVAKEDAECWWQRGGEAYNNEDWQSAVRHYTEAICLCEGYNDFACMCLSRRAACYAQLKGHARVVEDATDVINVQPANVNALLHRMVALDSQGKLNDALKDASAVLAMEPTNQQALHIVGKLKKPNEDLPKHRTTFFQCSKEVPLHCFACLRALRM